MKCKARAILRHSQLRSFEHFALQPLSGQPLRHLVDHRPSHPVTILLVNVALVSDVGAAAVKKAPVYHNGFPMKDPLARKTLAIGCGC